MQAKTNYVVIYFFISLTFFATLSSGCVPAKEVEAAPSSNTENMHANGITDNESIGGADTVPEPEATITEMPLQDGQSLLEGHCAACHVVPSLIRLEKSRPEWDMTLAQMKEMGVHLSDEEKDVLLDFLSTPDKP